MGGGTTSIFFPVYKSSPNSYSIQFDPNKDFGRVGLWIREMSIDEFIKNQPGQGRYVKAQLDFELSSFKKLQNRKIKNLSDYDLALFRFLDKLKSKKVEDPKRALEILWDVHRKNNDFLKGGNSDSNGSKNPYNPEVNLKNRLEKDISWMTTNQLKNIQNNLENLKKLASQSEDPEPNWLFDYRPKETSFGDYERQLLKKDIEVIQKVIRERIKIKNDKLKEFKEAFGSFSAEAIRNNPEEFAKALLSFYPYLDMDSGNVKEFEDFACTKWNQFPQGKSDHFDEYLKSLKQYERNQLCEICNQIGFTSFSSKVQTIKGHRPFLPKELRPKSKHPQTQLQSQAQPQPQSQNLKPSTPQDLSKNESIPNGMSHNPKEEKKQDEPVVQQTNTQKPRINWIIVDPLTDFDIKPAQTEVGTNRVRCSIKQEIKPKAPFLSKQKIELLDDNENMKATYVFPAPQGLTIEQLIDEVGYNQVLQKGNTCYIHSVLAALLYKDWGKDLLKEIITIADGSIKISLNMNQFSCPGPTHLLNHLNDKRPRLVRVFEAALVGFFGRRRAAMGTASEVLEALGLTYSSLLGDDTPFALSLNRWHNLKEIGEKKDRDFNVDKEEVIDFVRDRFNWYLSLYEKDDKNFKPLLNELKNVFKQSISRLFSDGQLGNLTDKRKSDLPDLMNGFVDKTLNRELEKFNKRLKRNNNQDSKWTKIVKSFEKDYKKEAQNRTEEFVLLAENEIRKSLDGLSPTPASQEGSKKQNINVVIDAIEQRLKAMSILLPELTVLPEKKNNFQPVLEEFRKVLNSQGYQKQVDSFLNSQDKPVVKRKTFMASVMELFDFKKVLTDFCNDVQNNYLRQGKTLQNNSQGLNNWVEVYPQIAAQNHNLKLIPKVQKAVKRNLTQLYPKIRKLYVEEYRILKPTIRKDCKKNVNNFLRDNNPNADHAMVIFDTIHWMVVREVMDEYFKCYNVMDKEIILFTRDKFLNLLLEESGQGFEGIPGVMGDLISILPPQKR